MRWSVRCCAVLGLITLLASPLSCTRQKQEDPEVIPATPDPLASGPGVATSQQPSFGITLEDDARLLPGPPGKVELTTSKTGATVRWMGTKLDILENYVVHRRCPGSEWERLARIPVRSPNEGWYEFIDPAGTRCDYAVSSFDHYGNEGPRSETVTQ